MSISLLTERARGDSSAFMIELTRNLAVVLVEPQGDANIGATARAIKNCGFDRLVLVNPVPFLTPRGRAMACQAQDVLRQAHVVSNLADALEDSSCSFGFTARTGRHRGPIHGYREAVAMIVDRLRYGRVALVFGREDDGLSGGELARCTYTASIPAHAAYTSFNLAQAVLIACHDVFMESNPAADLSPRENAEAFVERSQYRHVLDDLRGVLSRLGYAVDRDDALGSSIVARVADILGRAGLTHADVGMFEGLLARLKTKGRTP